MSWNRIILKTPEHQLPHRRWGWGNEGQGGWAQLWFIHSEEQEVGSWLQLISWAPQPANQQGQGGGRGYFKRTGEGWWCRISNFLKHVLCWYRFHHILSLNHCWWCEKDKLKYIKPDAADRWCHSNIINYRINSWGTWTTHFCQSLEKQLPFCQCFKTLTERKPSTPSLRNRSSLSLETKL